MTTKELCYYLSGIDGTSGDEKEIAEKASELLNEYMPAKIDRLGNVVGTTDGKGIHILLDAHIDRIGLIVRKIDDKGFLLVDKVGGVDQRMLTGSEVTVYGKEQLFGVICSTPPHLLTAEDKKAGVDIRTMAVDVGFSKEEAEKLVQPGDRITLNSFQSDLLSNQISSAALDDRCGIVSIIKCLEMISGKLKNIKLSVQFSVCEETGGSGAKTGAFSFAPDEAIAVDVGFGSDIYTDNEETIDLGKGPSIGISPVLDRKMMNDLINVAKENNIPYQHDVMSGKTGTNADNINITKGGVKTALLSIPLRNMHTPVEMIDVDDVDLTAKLLAEYLLKKDGECCD